MFSNGPLGVANGKDLVCNGCVGGNNLSTDAKTNLPLGSGQSETGYVAGGAGNSTSGYIAGGITFTRPVTAWNSLTTATGAGDPAHCPGIGSAARGYLCSYVHQSSSSATFVGVFAFSKYGGYMYWNVTSASPTPFVSSVWTVTAP